jgi:hypothetical protein
MRMPMVVVVITRMLMSVAVRRLPTARRGEGGTDRESSMPVRTVCMVFVPPQPMPVSDRVMHAVHDTTLLTVAYVRVSTEDQAVEGFSIQGQIDKLQAYATLHDLGVVTVIEDAGLSGKNTDRPGLQRVLAMVAEGHVSNVLVWRLDRLSRNLGDLVLLADTFGQAGVALHSFCERIDLSSATGRMFYNVLGSFAQFSGNSFRRTFRWAWNARCVRVSG